MAGEVAYGDSHIWSSAAEQLGSLPGATPTRCSWNTAKGNWEVLWQEGRLDGGQQVSGGLGEEPGKEPEGFGSVVCWGWAYQESAANAQILSDSNSAEGQRDEMCFCWDSKH